VQAGRRRGVREGLRFRLATGGKFTAETAGTPKARKQFNVTERASLLFQADSFIQFGLKRASCR